MLVNSQNEEGVELRVFQHLTVVDWIRKAPIEFEYLFPIGEAVWEESAGMILLENMSEGNFEVSKVHAIPC